VDYEYRYAEHEHEEGGRFAYAYILSCWLDMENALSVSCQLLAGCAVTKA